MNMVMHPKVMIAVMCSSVSTIIQAINRIDIILKRVNQNPREDDSSPK